MSVDEERMICVRINGVGDVQNDRRRIGIVAITTGRIGSVDVREEHWQTVERVYQGAPYAIFSVAKSSRDVTWG